MSDTSNPYYGGRGFRSRVWGSTPAHPQVQSLRTAAQEPMEVTTDPETGFLKADDPNKKWYDRPRQDWAATIAHPSAGNSLLSGGLGAEGDWRKIQHRPIAYGKPAFWDTGQKRGNAQRQMSGEENDPTSPTNPMAGAPSVAGGRDPFKTAEMPEMASAQSMSEIHDRINNWASTGNYGISDDEGFQPTPMMSYQRPLDAYAPGVIR